MSKSILEKALLEAEQLEETMKSNAKEILSSTMKEEIHELVKESLNENDYLKEQKEEVDVLDIDDEVEGDDLEAELPIAADIELDVEDEIVAGSAVVVNGEVRQPIAREALGLAPLHEPDTEGAE